MIRYFPWLLFAQSSIFFSFYSMSRWAGLFCLALFIFFQNNIKFSRLNKVEVFFLAVLAIILVFSIFKNWTYLGSVPGVILWLGFFPLLLLNFLYQFQNGAESFFRFLHKQLLLIIILGTPFLLFQTYQYKLNLISIPILTLGNTKHFSQFFSFVIAYLLACSFLEYRRQWPKYLSFTLSFLLGVALFFMEAKGSALALLALMIALPLFLKLKKNILWIPLIVLFLNISFLVILFLILLFYPQFFNFGEGRELIPGLTWLPSSFDHRIQIYSSALGILKDNFWIGVGPGQFLKAFPAYQNPFSRHYFWLENHFTDSSHNFFLDLAAECGFPFLIISLIFFYKLILAPILKNYKKLKSWEYLAFTLPFTVLIFEALSLFPHHLALSFTFAALVVSYGLYLAKRLGNKDQKYLSLKIKMISIPSILVIATLGGYYSYSDYMLAEFKDDPDTLAPVCDRFPIHWRLCGHVADLYLQKNQPVQAKRRYLKLLHSFPYHFPYLVGLSYAYANTGNIQESCSTLRVYETLLRRPTQDYKEIRDFVCQGIK